MKAFFYLLPPVQIPIMLFKVKSINLFAKKSIVYGIGPVPKRKLTERPASFKLYFKVFCLKTGVSGYVTLKTAYFINSLFLK